jgi:hypothetical protein
MKLANTVHLAALTLCLLAIHPFYITNGIATIPWLAGCNIRERRPVSRRLETNFC